MKELDKIRISGEQQIPRDFLWLKPVDGKYELLRPKGDTWDKVLIDGMYIKPNGGIPKNDLDLSVRNTLDSVSKKVSFKSITLESDTGILLDPAYNAFIISAFNNSYTNIFLVEDPDDRTNTHITQMHNNDMECILSFYDAENAENYLLIWNIGNIRTQIVIQPLKDSIPATKIILRKPAGITEYVPDVFVRKSDLAPIVISGTVEQYEPDPTEARDFFPDRTYSEGEFEELQAKIDRVVLNFEGVYVKASGYDSTSIYCSTPGIGYVQWNKPHNQ